MGKLIKSLTLALLIPFVQAQAEPEDEGERIEIEERNFYTEVINPKKNPGIPTRTVNTLLLYETGTSGNSIPDKENLSETYARFLTDELSDAKFYYASRDVNRDEVPFEKQFISALTRTASARFDLVRRVEDGVDKVQDATSIRYTDDNDIRYYLRPIVDSLENSDALGLKFSVERVWGTDEIYVFATKEKQLFGIEKKTSSGEFRLGAEFSKTIPDGKIGFSYGLNF